VVTISTSTVGAADAIAVEGGRWEWRVTWKRPGGIWAEWGISRWRALTEAEVDGEVVQAKRELIPECEVRVEHRFVNAWVIVERP